jgi:hypothetical protein
LVISAVLGRHEPRFGDAAIGVGVRDKVTEAGCHFPVCD